MTTTDKLNILLRTASPNELLLFQALFQIAQLDPSDTDEGVNEWGEAQCFCQAKVLASEAINNFINNKVK